MRYEKPEVFVLGSAVDAVRHLNRKIGCVADSDTSDHTPTDGCAYESDE